MAKIKKLGEAALKKLSPKQLEDYVSRHEKAAKREQSKNALISKAKKFAR